MDLMKHAMELIAAKEASNKAAKKHFGKSKITAFKEDGKVAYLIPGTMKRPSFDRQMDKHQEVIQEFRYSDQHSLEL